ncbi:MAG: hypothetical protein SVU32_01530 [Candidatus Nanohaloarchaea archaeon]|nr:hypothetical protein [Candidatus Nanohaloarchaea archaeon]
MGLTSLHERVMSHGVLFAAVFYLVTGLTAVSTIAGLLSSSGGGLLFDGGYLLLVFGLLWRENLYGTLVLTLLIPAGSLIVGVTALLPLVIGSAVAIYLVIGVVAFVTGAVVAYMFGALADTSVAAILPGVAASSFLAFAAGMVAVVTMLFRQLREAFQTTQPGGLAGGAGIGGSSFPLMGEPTGSPLAVLAVMLIGFNIPFLYRYRLDDGDFRLLVLYVVPLLVFGGVVVLGTRLVAPLTAL